MARALEGRNALVTGASRGIGQAIAVRLAREGARVGLVARSQDALEAAAAAIRTSGGRADVLALDVTDSAASADAIERVRADWPSIDILVNNAGRNVRKPAEAYSLDEWDALHALALRAPFHWSTLCYPAMSERGYGRIVNIGSVAGMTALPTGAPYAAAKAGLAQLTKNLAREWGPHGITVNLLAPWYVKTPLTEGVLGEPAYLESVVACTPTGRIGTPDEVAAAVAFLAGGEAGWINGAVIPLDGGFTSSAFYP